MLNSIEICAGAGGQAIGLEQAGFNHMALIEIDKMACETLRLNRPNWDILETDIKNFSAIKYKNKVDLFAGGIPCPPFSIAGKQLGEKDERNLFFETIRLIEECNPRAIMIENVKGILSAKFDDFRLKITNLIFEMGYEGEWRLLNASDYGVPQLRPRAIFVAFKKPLFKFFKWPEPSSKISTVSDAIYQEISSLGWKKSKEWKKLADKIAPTLVGGSKKHGGPDLGPTRARIAWDELGIDGTGIAEFPPEKNFIGKPKLTVKMAAIIQGFPKNWIFSGKKTPAYRQVGNAFPPPVAKAIGLAIYEVLNKEYIKNEKNFGSTEKNRLQRETKKILIATRGASA